MKLYVLEGLVAFEPSEVLGVYSSRALAEAAHKVVKSEQRFDDYYINEFILDGERVPQDAVNCNAKATQESQS